MQRCSVHVRGVEWLPLCLRHLFFQDLFALVCVDELEHEIAAGGEVLKCGEAY